MIVPFWSYFGSRTLEDLTDVVGQAMAFLPLGALLAARSWRQSFLTAILIGFSFGLVLELGQAFLPDRTPDVSDAISAAAGAGLGLALWRWGEFARTSSMGATRYRVGPRPWPHKMSDSARRLAARRPFHYNLRTETGLARPKSTKRAFALWNPQSA